MKFPLNPPDPNRRKPRIRVPSRPVDRFPIHHGHPEAGGYLERVWVTPAGEWRSSRPEPPFRDLPPLYRMPAVSPLVH
jgi:hypothetical protein